MYVYKQGGKCVFLVLSCMCVKVVFQVLRFLKLEFKPDWPNRTKYQMLPVVHECCSRLQVNRFCQLRACARTFCSVMFIQTIQKIGLLSKVSYKDGAIILELLFSKRIAKLRH